MFVFSITTQVAEIVEAVLTAVSSVLPLYESKYAWIRSFGSLMLTENVIPGLSRTSVGDAAFILAIVRIR